MSLICQTHPIVQSLLAFPQIPHYIPVPASVGIEDVYIHIYSCLWSFECKHNWHLNKVTMLFIRNQISYFPEGYCWLTFSGDCSSFHWCHQIKDMECFNKWYNSYQIYAMRYIGLRNHWTNLLNHLHICPNKIVKRVQWRSINHTRMTPTRMNVDAICILNAAHQVRNKSNCPSFSVSGCIQLSLLE